MILAQAAMAALVAMPLHAAAAVSRVGLTIGGCVSTLALLCAGPAAPFADAGAALLSCHSHLEGANICEGKPQTILNHTVSDGASGGVLNYFWQTQGFVQKKFNTSKGELSLPRERPLAQLWVDCKFPMYQPPVGCDYMGLF